MRSDYLTLFAAFREASDAFAKVSSLPDRSDAALARDPDYRRLYSSGLTIARIGGGEAVSAAMQALDAESIQIGRYWQGMDRF